MTFNEDDWCTRCSEIYSKLQKLAIFPLIEFLGIDKTHGTKSADRGLNGVKVFSSTKCKSYVVIDVVTLL